MLFDIVGYDKSRHVFVAEGPGWQRAVPVELLHDALQNPDTMLNRVLCEGDAV